MLSNKRKARYINNLETRKPMAPPDYGRGKQARARTGLESSTSQANRLGD